MASFIAPPQQMHARHIHILRLASPAIASQRPHVVAGEADWPWSSWQHPFHVFPPEIEGLPREVSARRQGGGTSAAVNSLPPGHHVFRIPRWTCDGAHLIQPSLTRKDVDVDEPVAEHVFLDDERSGFVNCSSPPRVQRRRYEELARSICWNKSKPSQEPGARSMMSFWPINCRIQELPRGMAV